MCGAQKFKLEKPFKTGLLAYGENIFVFDLVTANIMDYHFDYNLSTLSRKTIKTEPETHVKKYFVFL